jgi:hypothetical protein
VHLFVEGLLYLGVAYKDKAAVLEVEVFESVEVPPLEPMLIQLRHHTHI